MCMLPILHLACHANQTHGHTPTTATTTATFPAWEQEVSQLPDVTVGTAIEYLNLNCGSRVFRDAVK